MFEKEIIKHCESYPDQEVCGIILLEADLSVVVKPQINESPDQQECFSISQKKFINYKLTKTILGIYHSHPHSSEMPSVYDKGISEEMGIPYLIYSLKTKNFNLYCPESYEPRPLLGRPHIKGFNECTDILRDYFVDRLNINITSWNENYWLPEKDGAANKLLEKILNKNLIKVPKQDVKKHDVLVFELKEGARLHVGVCSGPNTFLHQPVSTLSREDILDDRWQNKIKSAYRHESLV